MKQAYSTLCMVIEFLCSHELRIWLRMAFKPLVVLGMVCLLCWLGGSLAASIAHAETTGLACPVGLEQSGALCYPPCQAGFYGDGPVCWQTCPTDHQDDGGFCRKAEHIFTKASYGRGAGVGLSCAANQEAQGGLCYPRCNPGFYGVGPVCWQFCRPGYSDHGATCFRSLFDFYFKATYGRGAGGPVSVCAVGLERSGSLCYPRCNAGFAGAGPVCFQQCPAGYKDDGAFCRRDGVIFAKLSVGRGAGEVLNSVPEAIDETIFLAKDTAGQITFAHDDLNDDTGKPILIIQEASHGSLNDRTYTPNPGFEGADTILWKTTDGKNESNVAVATLIVGNVGANDAPVAVDRTVEVREDTPITVTVTCTDANNDPLFYQLVEPPQHGQYQWLAPNQVVYTPTLEFVGVDHFTFRSYDGRDFSNVSTITLTVGAVNDAPVVLAQPITTTRNSNAAINLFAQDAEGEPISYTVVSSPTHGVLSGAAPTLLYTPNPDFTGADSLQVQASDAQGAATVATIHVTILPTNTAPLAESLVFTTSEESAVTVNLTASDADGDALHYSVVTSPTHGLLTGAGAAWIYTPNPGFTGREDFTFQASDGQAHSTVATVTINVVAAPAVASVAGLVFDDQNGNGQPDANETGVHGLQVTLTAADPQANQTFTITTDSIGGWRIDGVPLGQYTLRITSANGMQLKAPSDTTITLRQRGLQQLQPVGVDVISSPLFLPVVTR
jgi:hypothetical protein